MLKMLLPRLANAFAVFSAAFLLTGMLYCLTIGVSRRRQRLEIEERSDSQDEDEGIETVKSMSDRIDHIQGETNRVFDLIGHDVRNLSSEVRLIKERLKDLRVSLST